MARFPTVAASALALLAAAAILAGCGNDAPARTTPPISLLLDFTPNAVHTPIYAAIGEGDDRRAGVALSVHTPGSSTSAIAALLAGKTDLAIFDIHDLALADDHRHDLVAVAAIVSEPLAAVIAAPSIARPRQLEGRRVGVTGLPSDVGVLRSIVTGDGGDPARVRRTTIGFNAVPSLLSGRVAAATAFWSVEGVALERRRRGFHSFRVTDYGAPRYPELVLVTTRATLRRRHADVVAVIAALRRGYALVKRDEPAALDALLRANPTLDRDTTAAQLRQLRPAFTDGARPYGTLDRTVLERWARWVDRFGITRHVPDVGQLFATDVAGGR